MASLFACLAALQGVARAETPPPALWNAPAWPDTSGSHINAHGGGMLFHDGQYHWFGEHKGSGKGGSLARVGVRVYTSPDLEHWTDAGVALAVSDDPGSEIRAGCRIERPKVVFNEATGKFVMWFHLELAGHGYNAARAGIAVSDSVHGPYTYLGSVRPNPGRYPMEISEALRERVARRDFDEPPIAGDREASERIVARNFFVRQFYGGQMARDQTVFVDDDGAAYHVFASESNRTLHIAELDATYTRHTGRYVRLFEGASREAPVLFRRNGVYHLITSGCTGWSANPARHATARSIWGPWTVHGNPCEGERSETTFGSQGTFAFPVRDEEGMPTDRWIFMADRWNPADLGASSYLWLEVEFEGDRAILRER